MLRHLVTLLLLTTDGGQPAASKWGPSLPSRPGAAAKMPALFFRFEDATNVGLDSSPAGLNLKVPKASSGKWQPQPMAVGGPVGGFVSFGSDATVPINASQRRVWAAHTTAGLPAAPGITLEFLIKPNPGFLRGGSAEPLPGLSFAAQGMTWTVTTDLGERELSLPLGGAVKTQAIRHCLRF